MGLTPGLKHTIRQDASHGLGAIESIDEPANDIEIADGVNFDGKSLRVEHDDGSITISLDGKPIDYDEDEATKAREWFANLVDDIDDMERQSICENLLRGIQDDLDSRQEWIEDRAEGIRLLGLKIESNSLNGSSDGAPVEGMSRVRHPLLLEACLRFQANARSELLPTDGPVKVRVDYSGSTIETDELATNLENDLNHYLTDDAAEYYPDTDRMLLMLGFGGTAFKKVYFCPLRGRPISESVDAEDLIVNNMAVTLEDARRITHRVMMRPSTVKRLQILDVYRDVDLITPSPTDPDSVKQEKSSQQGLSFDVFTPEDRDREIYECYCELDIKGYEHKHKGKVTGLEIPYRVTIDVSSREILSIVRNYDEPTGEDGDVLPLARKNFVKYNFVPGLGFYDIGLLHILGNTTNAVTALWREMLDAGMFANFPGALIADTGARQNTNMFRIPPGGAALVKTGGLPINQAVMPLPYKEPGPAMFNLAQSMVETGQRVGMTAELQVGEGRQDAPVGTTLALIDQATKVMNSVHKRLHRSQTDEFRLLVRTFKEHPESFMRGKSGKRKNWTESLFIEAINNYELVPQADPNTASQLQRQMKVSALMEMSQANPTLYDTMAVNLAALKAFGWSNPEQFLLSAEKRGQLPPELQNAAQELKIMQQEVQAKTLDAQSKAELAKANIAKIQSEIGMGQQGTPPDRQAMAEMQFQHKELNAKAQETQVDALNRQRDRESRERLAAVRLAEKMADNPAGIPIVHQMIEPEMIKRLENNEDTIPGTDQG